MSFRQFFKFLFISTSTVMLIITIAFNFGASAALTTTLPTKFVSQGQVEFVENQAENQIRSAVKNVNDQLQEKDIARASNKKLEDDTQAAFDDRSDDSKIQSTEKMKQSGGLKGNIGWLTF